MTSEEFARADEGLIGRLIAGKFALRRCVGVGASGAVYEADQIALGRTVAIKILRPDLASDPRFVNRFQDEALAASRLNHPNTVSIIDYGQTEDGLLYLVMEFLRGHTLTHIVQSQTLATPRIADIITQVLSGLEEAHEAGIVHADLKADNIMVEHRRKNWDLVKVVDFGIARLIGRPEERTERTICGTPEYMAPEVIRGNEPTFASDLYAVGVVLYELLAGVTPYAGSTTMEILTRHLKEAPVPPSARVDRAIDPLLSRIALRALAKRPGDRFDSAADFRVALLPATSKESASDRQEVLCTACGVESSGSFKFCPECGQPREARQSTEEIGPGDLPRQVGALALRDTMDAAAAGLAELEERPAFPSSGQGLHGSAPGARHSDSAPLPPDKFSTVRATRRFEVLELDRSAGGILPLPLVGRDRELIELQQFIAGKTGPQALEIVGPEGIGKTRLILDACARAAQVGTTVFVTGPDPSGLAAPYYPIRAIVAGILGLAPVCTYEGLGEALEANGLTRRDLPGMGELFGCSADLSQLDPQIRRRELLVSTIRALQSPAQRGRTLLVFEDVDRYDQPSVDVVRRLADSETEDPLRVVITRSPVPNAAAWPGSIGVIDLGALPAQSLEALAAHISSRPRTDMPDAGALYTLAKGSPGHVHQLVRYIVEGGTVESAPRGIADLIAARLDHLPADAKQVCQAAAVFGSEVGLDVLTAASSGIVSKEEFRSALSFLEARGIITEQYGIVRFEQHLFRDVVYESTPANVRRDLHRDAGLVLEQLVRDPAVLGHHADLAGKTRRAAHLLGLAGDSAVQQLDDRGSVALYTRGLVAARAIMLADDEPESREQFVSISAKLADSLRVVGEVALARGIVTEAMTFSSDLPLHKVLLVRAAAHLQASVGEMDAALSGVREAIGLAIMVGQPDLLIDLYLDLAATSLRAGQARGAITELEEAIDLITAGEGAASGTGPREMWHLLLRLAQLHASMGDANRAIAIGEHAARHAARTGARSGIARANSLLATQYEKIGNRARAESSQRRAIDQLRQLGDRRGTAELLLSGARPSRTLLRITPWLAREARELAHEIGWEEGVRRAERLGSID